MELHAFGGEYFNCIEDIKKQRSNTIGTPKFIQSQNVINDDPGNSMKTFAKEFRVA